MRTTIWMSLNNNGNLVRCHLTYRVLAMSRIKPYKLTMCLGLTLESRKWWNLPNPAATMLVLRHSSRYNMIVSFLSSTTAASQVEYWAKLWVFQWHLTTADRSPPFTNITFQSCLKRETVLKFSLITKTRYKLFLFYVFHHYSLRFSFENRHHLFTLKLC